MKAQPPTGSLEISNYLRSVYRDWETSRTEFPHNT